MYEMELLVFVLVSYGLTQIIVYAKVLDRIRPTQGWVGKLLSCSMCTGFWVGVFLWAISNLTSLFMFDSSLVTAFLLGCLSSGTSYTLCQLFGDGGIRYEKMDDSASTKV